MPNAVLKVLRPSTSTCEMLHEIRVSIDRLIQEPMLFTIDEVDKTGAAKRERR
jgi:hypothetical protein